MLVAIQTHPIQYHAPVFRAVQQQCHVPVTAIYGSDFSIRGYRDPEFGTTVTWDTDLLSGYSSEFLARSDQGGARDVSEVSARGLGTHLARLRPAAVLIGGYSPAFHRTALFSARRLGIPVLLRAETTDKEPAATLKRVPRRVALRGFYAQCSRFLYIGQASKRHYEALGCQPGSLVFSPYCVDESSFASDESGRERMRAPARAALGVQPDGIVVLFSGKLTPKKRPDLLLKAMADVHPAIRRPVTVVYLGDGELRTELEAQSTHLSGVQVRFVGFKRQRELSPFYHAADILVLPSQHSETWGLVVNEALLHGVPCVVSDAVGCRDDLVRSGHTGERFATGSASDLASALHRTLSLTGRADVRAECRALAGVYSVSRAAAGIAEAYRSVAPSDAN